MKRTDTYRVVKRATRRSGGIIIPKYIVQNLQKRWVFWSAWVDVNHYYNEASAKDYIKNWLNPLSEDEIIEITK